MDVSLYLFIIIIEVVLYVYARLPPPLYTLTNTCKLVIGISAIVKGLSRSALPSRTNALLWPKVAVEIVLLYV